MEIVFYTGREQEMFVMEVLVVVTQTKCKRLLGALSKLIRAKGQLRYLLSYRDRCFDDVGGLVFYLIALNLRSDEKVRPFRSTDKHI